MQDLLSARAQAADYLLVAGPSTSRMISNYLADIEHLLDAQRWDLARRDALDLPTIAVSLENPHLTASPARCLEWCARWLPELDDGAPARATREQVLAAVAQHVGASPAAAADAGSPGHDRLSETAAAVPTAALRGLRLRRHARSRPRGFKARMASNPTQHAAASNGLCTALMEALRRWYAQSAVHNPLTQSNLARLAVLR